MMKSNRRKALGHFMAGGLIATTRPALADRSGPITAVAFDGFAVLDPRPVFALTENLFPGKGADLATAWKTRQFEYAWLRTMAHQYADFRRVTEDSLVFAAKMLKVDLSSSQRARLMDAYLEIRCWPDVPAALRTLKNAGIRLAFLSNMTQPMLQAGIRNSGLEQVFDYVLSTDLVRAYKPDPRAYQMGMDAFRVRREDILFAAFAGWDAAGSKAFGFPTFWVNRQKQPTEELGFAADASGETLVDLVNYIKR